MGWTPNGFIPYLFWSLSNPYLEKNIIFHLVEKFNSLSSKIHLQILSIIIFEYTVTYMPWSIFDYWHNLRNVSYGKENKYLLTYFPLILIAILSFFLLKNPYYTTNFLNFTLNTYVGINYLFNSKNINLVLYLSLKNNSLYIIITITYYFYFKNIITF